MSPAPSLSFSTYWVVDSKVCGLFILGVCAAAMSSPAIIPDDIIDEIERSFGSRLVLTPLERAGVVIGSSDVADRFVGFIHSCAIMPMKISQMGSPGGLN